MTNVYEHSGTADASKSGFEAPVNGHFVFTFLVHFTGSVVKDQRLICHANGFTAGGNAAYFICQTSNTFGINLKVYDQSDQQIQVTTAAVPADTWLTVTGSFDGTTLSIDATGVAGDSIAASTAKMTGKSNRTFKAFQNNSPGATHQMSEINLVYDGSYELNFPCNEGSGTIWTETAQGLNGTLTNDSLHATAQPGYPSGPPTTVTFGPVATNDDPSVTAWNWEASSDSGSNWGEAENVLSDVSGEATTSLVVNSATPAENGTQVRCRATSAKEPAGVLSAVATLTVETAP